jgi:hypothetical protein
MDVKFCRGVSNEITAEDFSAAWMKILKDALKDPASRAGDEYIWPKFRPFVEGICEFVLRIERSPPSIAYESATAWPSPR